MKSQRVQLFHCLIVPSRAGTESMKVKALGRLRNEWGFSSDKLALLSLEREIAGETIETELSQVKGTACVAWSVLF